VDRHAWIDRLKAGDAIAFDEIFELFRPRLFGFVVRLCPSRVAAEDIVQETFVRLVERRRRLDPGTDLGGWLFTVARNLARSQGRWRAVAASASAVLGAAPSSTVESPMERAAGSEALRHLERALARVAPKHREVLLLVGLEGLSAAEAGTILGLSAEALRQRLSRARAALARAMGEVPPEGSG